MIAIKKMFAQILFWLYELLDNIFEMFQVLCGVQKVSIEGEDGENTLLNVFLESNTVTKAFWLILLIAVAVAGIATIASVVKNIINLKGGERKPHSRSIGQGFGSIIISLVMAVVMITGIALSGEVLSKVSTATTSEVNASFSNQLFGMSVGKTYEFDYEVVYETDETGNSVPKKDINGDIITAKKYKEDENGEPIFSTGWKDDKPKSIDFSKVTPDQVFGVRETNLLGIEDENKGYKNGCEAWVELDSFNFLTAYLVVIVMMVSLVFCMLGLVKRIFDIVMLFIIMPLITSTIPLDDGARFKSWRDSVVSKVVLAYGAVLSVNVFLLIVPIINTLQFDQLGWTGFLENLFKAFLMMGGALAINGGQLLLARLMGSSAEESREMAHSARALFAGAASAGGLMRGTKNLLAGGQNKYGRQRTGLLNFGARLGTAIGERAGKDTFKDSFGGKMMRKFGRLPQLQQPNVLMQSMDRNIKSIAEVLSGGSGNATNSATLGVGASSAENGGNAGGIAGSGVSSLVGTVLPASANKKEGGNTFSKPNKK